MILHLDMDAFFAAVEKLDNPKLADKCVIVGSLSRRAVVAAASYEARRFGVHSAMPVYQALQLCPQAVIIPPRHRRYAEVSARVMACLETFSPLVEQVSIDEAFVDVSGLERLHGPLQQMARDMKAAVFARVGLTCSVGIAPCKFLAKIASDMDKPDGLTIIDPDQLEDFISALPVAKVPGVGDKTRQVLSGMGIETLGQLKQWPEKALVQHLGSFGLRLARLSQGLDDSPVKPRRPVKSVSQETTLEVDSRDRSGLQRYLLMHAQAVARSLRRKDLQAEKVFLKLKTSTFRLFTRQRKLEHPTQSANHIYRIAQKLLEEFEDLPPIRLVGLGVSVLQSPSCYQPSLFVNQYQDDFKWEKVERAADQVIQRFGRGLVKPASLTGSAGVSSKDLGNKNK